MEKIDNQIVDSQSDDGNQEEFSVFNGDVCVGAVEGPKTRMNPRELETYLFQPSFSLQSHVVPKSTTIPEKPTTQNFRNLSINVLLIMDFDFKGKAVHRAVNDIVQTDDNGSVGNVSDNGAATQTPAGGYDHTRVNRACYRSK